MSVQVVKRYVTIPENIIRDTTLSYAALGLYVYIQSFPQNGEGAIEHESYRHKTIDEQAIIKLIKELIAHDLVNVRIE